MADLTQAEFFRALFGEASGYMEIADLAGRQQWVRVEKGTLTEGDIEGSDLYFKPVLFEEASADSPLVPGILIIGSDEDDVRPDYLSTVRTSTSRGRFNSFWVLIDDRSLESSSSPSTGLGLSSAEERYNLLRMKLAPTSQPVWYHRIPGTYSTKRCGAGGAPFLVGAHPGDATPTGTSMGAVMRLPGERAVQPISEEWFTWYPQGGGVDDRPRLFLIGRLADRSAQLFDVDITRGDRLLLTMAQEGLEPWEMLWVALQSPGIQRGYGAAEFSYGWEREVAKLCVIAHLHTTKSEAIDLISQERRVKRPAFLKMANIANMVHADMKREGSFLYSIDEIPWYVDKEGRSFQLSPHSTGLRNHLTRIYGLSPIEDLHRSTVHELIARTTDLPQTADVSNLSHYDPEEQEVLCTFDGRSVISITPESISLKHNGDDGIVFRPTLGQEPIPSSSIRISSACENWWDEFAPPEHFCNIVGLDPKAASLMAHIWVIFSMIKSGAGSRPLLALMGDVGSGKSTWARRFYRLTYGGLLELFALTSGENYEHTTSSYPTAIFDNADQFRGKGWVSNKFAISINPKSFPKRKLFTDNETFLVRCDAAVGFTAFDPSFLREDITERLLPFSFRKLRPPERKREMSLMNDISRNRPHYLAGLVLDLQRLLCTPQPDVVGSDIRMVDWDHLGQWIATSLGRVDEFRDCVYYMGQRQAMITVEADHLLMEALLSWRDSGLGQDWTAPRDLYEQLIIQSGMQEDQFRYKYRTSAVLSRKLKNIKDAISYMIDLETKEDDRSGYNLWRLKPEEPSAAPTRPRRR